MWQLHMDSVVVNKGVEAKNYNFKLKEQKS